MICLALLLLTACNAGSINEGLVPPKVSTNTSAQSSDPVPGQTVGSENALAAQQTTSPAQTAVNAQTQTASLVQPQTAGNADSISFLPVEGVPQGAISTLSSSLKQSARTNGLSIVPANQPGAKYRVKGHFSALNDGSGTLLIYIWDVIDGSGKRIYRINGQERTSSVSSDPWRAITSTELDRVAMSTTDGLKSWLSTR